MYKRYKRTFKRKGFLQINFTQEDNRSPKNNKKLARTQDMSTAATFREMLVGSPLARPAMIEEYKAPLADFPALEYPMFVSNSKTHLTHFTLYDHTNRPATVMSKPYYPTVQWKNIEKWSKDGKTGDIRGWTNTGPQLEEGEIPNTSNNDTAPVAKKVKLDIAAPPSPSNKVTAARPDWLPTVPSLSPYPWYANNSSSRTPLILTSLTPRSVMSPILRPLTPPPSPAYTPRDMPDLSLIDIKYQDRPIIKRRRRGGKNRGPRSGKAIQRPNTEKHVPGAPISLTPLPGRPSPMRVGHHRRSLLKADGIWQRRGNEHELSTLREDPAEYMASGTNIPGITVTPPRLLITGSSPPLDHSNKRAHKSSKKQQLIKIMSTIKRIEHDIIQLPDSNSVKEARTMATHALDTIDKLENIVVMKQDLQNRPTIRYVNSIHSDLRNRIVALEEQQNAPLHEREQGILGFAVAQMKRGDEIIDQLVWDAHRKAEELRKELMEKINRLDERANNSEALISTLNKDFKMIKGIYLSSPEVHEQF